jgi:phage replication O-like protein O
VANPQTEHGFTRIANEIMDALALANMPGGARRVLDVVIRKTYGFGKKKDWISTSQIAKATGLDTRVINRHRAWLKKARVLTPDKTDRGKVGKIGFNKNWEEWLTPDKTDRGPLTKMVHRPLTKVTYTKETITKESIKETSRATPAEAALKDIYDHHKINVYQILNRFKKDLRARKVTMLGSEYRVPDEVILETCEGFKKSVVGRPYPWFLKVLRQELELWWVNKQDKENTAMKVDPVTRDGDMKSIQEIIEAMMKKRQVTV